MKKAIHIIIILFLCSATATAQIKYKRNSREKIKSYKISYITNELNLTPKQAEKFWPVYNKYDEELHELRIKERYLVRKSVKEAGGLENISEKEAENIVAEMLQLEQQVYETEKAFYKKLRRILPAKKILALEIAEHNFHRKLFRKLRYKRRQKNKKGS